MVAWCKEKETTSVKIEKEDQKPDLSQSKFDNKIEHEEEYMAEDEFTVFTRF